MIFGRLVASKYASGEDHGAARRRLRGQVLFAGFALFDESLEIFDSLSGEGRRGLIAGFVPMFDIHLSGLEFMWPETEIS